MKKIALALLICLTLTGCGGTEERDPALVQFEQDINTMCDSIASIDEEINSMEFSYEDADAFKDAKDALIEQLRLLEDEFKGLFSYGALKRRLSSNKYEGNELYDYSQPVIKLRSLTNEEIFILFLIVLISLSVPT